MKIPSNLGLSQSSATGPSECECMSCDRLWGTELQTTPISWRRCVQDLPQNWTLAFPLFGTAPAKMFSGLTYSRHPAAQSLTGEHFSPDMSQIRPNYRNLAENSTDLGGVARKCSSSPKNRSCSPEFVPNRPGLVEFARKLSKPLQVWSRIRSSSPEIRRFRSRTGRVVPKIAKDWPNSPNLPSEVKF